jgi:hypothetical protein
VPPLKALGVDSRVPSVPQDAAATATNNNVARVFIGHLRAGRLISTPARGNCHTVRDIFKINKQIGCLRTISTHLVIH